jgi:ribosome-associated translation inhibitor RaiA
MMLVTNLRLQTQVKQLKEVSQQTEEFLTWLKDHADLPDVPGLGASLINAINHQSNMAAYFDQMQQSLKNQIKKEKEKKPS